MASKAVMVEVDEASGVAYVRFSRSPVKRTVAVNDAINVDLDEFDMTVGIEILDLDVDMPFQTFVDDFHVPSDSVDVLRLMRPSMTKFVYQIQGGSLGGSDRTVGVATPC